MITLREVLDTLPLVDSNPAPWGGFDDVVADVQRMGYSLIVAHQFARARLMFSSSYMTARVQAEHLN